MTGAMPPEGGATARDVRLLDQSARALRRVSDWLNDTTEHFDGLALDSLGEVIHAVDRALDQAEADRVS